MKGWRIMQIPLEGNMSSDAEGFFVLEDLGADTYEIITKKANYRRDKQTVTIEEGEEKEIEIIQMK